MCYTVVKKMEWLKGRPMNNKKMNWKEKIGYVFDYYKWWVLGGVVLIGVLIYALHYSVQIHPDTIAGVTLVNADTITVEESDWLENYIEENNISKTDRILVDASLAIHMDGSNPTSSQSYQVLSAELLSSEIDLLITDQDTFEYINSAGTMMPLTELLSQEQLEMYSEQLIYLENSATKKVEPVGISMENCSTLKEEHFFKEDGKIIVAGIPTLSEHQEEAVKLVMYLLREN